MLVIIYLLEDEQELSLGMLIRPKNIYNFCLFHAYIGDIAMCFVTLSCLLQHIWTNLLTQCPSASFCLLLSVHCRKMSNIKVLGKIQKNHIKNQQSRRVQKAGGGPEGPHPLTRRVPVAARVGPRHLATWSGGG